MGAPSQSALQAETETRLRFEMLLADVCAQFVNVAPSDVDSKIENAQRVICESLRVDHSSLWQVSEENPDLLVMTYIYRDPNLKPLPLRPSAKEYFPWGYNKILNKETVCVPNTATLPPEATKDRESWEQYGIHSSLVFPLSAGGGSLIGVLAFDNMEAYDWSETLQRRLQILVYVFAQALERKRVEQKVRESERRFRLLADTVPVLIWQSGRDKLCTYFNKLWLEFTGRSLESELGNGWAEGVHPEDLQRCLDTYTQSFDRREKFRMEYRLRRRDGEYRWILDVGVPRFDQDRSFVGYIGIGVDVTDRKRAEEELRGSEERLRLAAKAGKMYAYEWDPRSDVVTRLSEEYGNTLGLIDPAEQVTRQQLAARVHPDDRARFISSVDQPTPENPTTQISYRVVRPDGALIWLEKSGRAFFDAQGRLVRMMGMVADITEHKRTEQALRESEDKLRLLLDSTAEAIYGIDLEHRCTFCNPACLRTLGYERLDEVLGKNMHDLIHHTRADGTPFPVEECGVHRVARTGERVHAEDELLWRANGTSFPVEYWSYPQRRGEEVVRAVVAFVDITERKLAETALANVSRKLIEAQEQERSRIGRELHDDIGQRLAMVAIQLQQVHEDSLVLPEVRNRMGELKKEISGIADDIQSLSHELHSAKLQYLGIASAMRGFCQEFAKQQKVEIDFKAHDLPSPLSPDISLCLFRVLQEALHNSAKHSGVRHFEVRLWGTSDEIHLTVKDSGAGFDRETAKESRGLGLVSMEERLKLVNGTLSIDSQPKRGTTIHARLPFSLRSDSMRATG